MRVAMLSRGWAGYADVPFRRLAARGVELLIVHPASMPDTDFAWRIDEYAEAHPWSTPPEPSELVELVRRFDPDAVVMQSWDFAPYRAVMKSLPDRVLRILWMDNVWRNIPKQWLGRMVSRAYVQPLYDVALVPSDRTEFFARRLGFAPHDVIRGMLTADTDLFASGPRAGEELAGRHRFLSVLRLVHHKGADVLAEAYREYRTMAVETGETGGSGDPWDLDVVGIGPMRDRFEGIDGVHLHGFLQPPAVADLMRSSSCYVNPSREEPYAVVLHEAAVAGMPLLCTDFVGAAPTMIQDGYNGWVVTGGRPDLLAAAMARMSDQGADRLEEMSAISRNLGSRLSPDGWARNLHEEILRRTS